MLRRGRVRLVSMHSTKLLIITLILLVGQQFVSPLALASISKQIKISSGVESVLRASLSQSAKFMGKASHQHGHGYTPSITQSGIQKSDAYSFDISGASAGESGSGILEVTLSGKSVHDFHDSLANMVDCCDTTCFCCGGDCQPVVAVHNRRLPDSFAVVSFIPDSTSFPANSSQSLYRPPIFR